MEAVRMLALAFGNMPAQAVAVAARLGIVDRLADRPRSADELAPEIGSDPLALRRLLRALAFLDVVTEHADGRFETAPLGQTLRKGAPGSVRDAVIMAGDPIFSRACVDMEHSIRTGEPAFDHVFGAPFFDYQREHPQAGDVFARGMANFSELENAAIAAAYPFPGGARVVDVGGGRGGFIAEVLKAQPSAKGVLYDQSAVVREATYLRAADVADRCDIVAGSFFTAVPGGGDVYVLKRILHDWDDATCIRVLQNVRAVLPPDGRVLAIDAVLAPPGTKDEITLFDLMMMMILPGRERTEAEFGRLYEAAGLRLLRVVPTPSPLAIVEGGLA